MPILDEDAERIECLFVLSSYAPGGAERVMLLLAAGVQDASFRTAVVVLNAEGPLRASLPPGLAVYELGELRVRQALLALVRFVHRYRPRLLFSSFPHVTLALALLAKVQPPPPIGAREANLPSLSLSGGGVNRLLRMGCGFAYPRCKLVVASSERMQRELAQAFKVPDERLFVLPNPIDEEQIRTAAREPVDWPDMGDEGPDRRLFVAAGRSVPQKGFDRLIELWRLLPDDHHLSVLGDGPARPKLEELIHDGRMSERVRLLGHVTNPWAWYARADALLMPSRFEGMPNAALEALACGTPVVATPEAGGLAELRSDVAAGSLRVAEFGSPFQPTILDRPRCHGRSPRQSLLPRRHHLRQVSKVLGQQLRQVLQ